MKKLSLIKIRRFFQDKSSVDQGEFSQEDYLKAGTILKSRRKEYGITRKDLSIRTKISIAVLEAIEEGWIEKLPERAYLIKMINLLSKELRLPNDTFAAILNSPLKFGEVNKLNLKE